MRRKSILNSRVLVPSTAFLFKNLQFGLKPGISTLSSGLCIGLEGWQAIKIFTRSWAGEGIKRGTLRYWNNGPRLRVIKFRFEPYRQWYHENLTQDQLVALRKKKYDSCYTSGFFALITRTGQVLRWIVLLHFVLYWQLIGDLFFYLGIQVVAIFLQSVFLNYF